MSIPQWVRDAGLYAVLAVNAAAMGSCMYMAHDESKKACVLRWAESSTPSKVTKAGCMVEKTPGNWVPEKYMRDGR